MGMLDALLSRRALLSAGGLAVGLFVLAGVIGAIWGQHPDNGFVDAVGAIVWFGWMIAALVTVLLSVTALVRRATAGSSAAER